MHERERSSWSQIKHAKDRHVITIERNGIHQKYNCVLNEQKPNRFMTNEFKYIQANQSWMIAFTAHVVCWTAKRQDFIPICIQNLPTTTRCRPKNNRKPSPRPFVSSRGTWDEAVLFSRGPLVEIRASCRVLSFYPRKECSEKPTLSDQMFNHVRCGFISISFPLDLVLMMWKVLQIVHQTEVLGSAERKHRKLKVVGSVFVLSWSLGSVLVQNWSSFDSVLIHSLKQGQSGLK